MVVFIIEHLEPTLSEWCLIEYERILSIVGKDNLWFTNIKKRGDNIELSKLGKVFSESVRDLSFDMSKVCVLDPQAEQTLKPNDKKHFGYFVLGGILGDYPPAKRTRNELTKFLPLAYKRSIGKKQFSTDNAVWVVNEIINNGKKFKDLKFKDKFELKINDVESIILPYLYPIDEEGKQIMSPKIIAYLKRKKGF